MGANRVRTADVAFRPRRRPQPPPGQGSNSLGVPYPTVAIEIASKQTINSLHLTAADYFSPRTTIQIYLGIKLYPPRPNGTVAMVAMLYLRSSPTNTITTVAISFGTAPIRHNTVSFLRGIGVPDANILGVGRGAPPCNGPGIPVYCLNLPAVDLYNGDPLGVPGVAANGWNLDLWHVQVDARLY